MRGTERFVARSGIGLKQIGGRGRSSDYQPTQGVVGKALRLLDEVTLSASPVPLAKLVRATGLPMSTSHRVLSTLVSEGVLDRVGHRYQLNPEWVRRLRAGPQEYEQRLRWLLTPYLVDLHTGTGLCAGVAVWRGNDVHVVTSVFGHGDPVAVEQLTKSTTPCHAAAGRLFLATSLPNTDISTSTSDLDEELAMIRSRGVAMSRSRRLSGVVGLATRVMVGPRLAPVALTLSGPAERVETPSVSMLLRQTAYAASMRLRQQKVTRRDT